MRRQTSSPCTTGEIAIEDHDVVVGDRQAVESIGPVESDVDRHPLPPESDADRTSEHGVVFDDENSHATMIPAFR